MRASLRALDVELGGAAGVERAAERPGQQTLSFDPVTAASTDPNQFQCFWSNGRAWGRYSQRRDAAAGDWIPEIEVMGGALDDVTISACGKSWTVTA